MKVHLIKRQSIEDFVVQNARSKTSFGIWLSLVKYADWNEPNDIKSTFGSADILGNSSNRVVFNIGGNSYRMICKYHFGIAQAHLYVKWIGTHAEYTELCSQNKQYNVNDF